MAEAYRLAGRADEAVAAATDAYRLASEQGERGSAAGALRMLAAATADAKSYEAALDAARALGLRPVEALCHLGRAILAESARDAVPAREHAARALEMLRAMDMRYWLPRAESLAVTAADRAQSGSRASRNP